VDAGSIGVVSRRASNASIERCDAPTVGYFLMLRPRRRIAQSSPSLSGVSRSTAPLGESACRSPIALSIASGPAVMPASASWADSIPDFAARPPWKGLVMVPKFAITPPAWDADNAIAWLARSASSRIRTEAAAAAAIGPKAPVGCHPLLCR